MRYFVKLLLFLCVATVLGSAMARAEDHRVLKLGVLCPLSGNAAASGRDIQNGVDTAVDLFIEQGGVPGFRRIQVLVEDSACNARQAVAGAIHLVRDGVAAVVGAYCSSATIPASEVLDAHMIPMVTPSSTNPQVTARGLHYMFRMCGADPDQADAATRFITLGLKAKSLFIIDDNTLYSRTLADLVERKTSQNGVRVLGRKHVATGQAEFSEVLEKVRTARPEVLYVSLQDSESGIRLFRQLHDLGLKDLEMKILSQDAVFHPDIIAKAPQAVQNVFFTFGFTDTQTAMYKQFIMRHTELYGDPGAYAASAFDSAWAILTAVKNAETTRSQALRSALLKLDTPGASKQIRFQENGDSTSNFIVYQVQAERFQPYYNPQTISFFSPSPPAQ